MCTALWYYWSFLWLVKRFLSQIRSDTGQWEPHSQMRKTELCVSSCNIDMFSLAHASRAHSQFWINSALHKEVLCTAVISTQRWLSLLDMKIWPSKEWKCLSGILLCCHWFIISIQFEAKEKEVQTLWLAVWPQHRDGFQYQCWWWWRRVIWSIKKTAHLIAAVVCTSWSHKNTVYFLCYSFSSQSFFIRFIYVPQSYTFSSCFII